MIGLILKFVRGNSLIIIIVGMLATSTAVSAYMLKKNIEKNAVLKQSVQQWKIANDLSIKAYQELNEKLKLRDKLYRETSIELVNLQTALAGVKDESNCLDKPIPDGVRMLLKETASN